MQKDQAKIIEQLTKLIGALVLIIIALVVYILIPNKEEQLTDNEGYCGVIDYTSNEVDINDPKRYRSVANLLESDFEPNTGELLFKTYCAACHSISENRLVGPGLKGHLERINEKSEAITFLQSYQQDILPEDSLREIKHPYAELEEHQIIDILGYIGMF